jgi:nitrile hydratase accessory protein
MSAKADLRPDAPFSAPWEAQAFALAVALADTGAFAWREFSEALGAEIAASTAQGRGDAYYALWLAALEKVVARKGIVSSVVLQAREAAVKEAALLTTHAPAASRRDARVITPR